MSERTPFPSTKTTPEHRRTVRIGEDTQSRRFMGHVMGAMVKRDSAHLRERVVTDNDVASPYIPAAEEVARHRALLAAQELANSN